MEDYLETILMLMRDNGVARSKDIVKRLKVNRSSVAGAIQALSDRGLVNHELYGGVTLTADGKKIAAGVLRRHEALRDFMVEVLEIDPAEADEAACRMEHGISRKIVDRFAKFSEFMKTCPQVEINWVRGFGYRCRESGPVQAVCEKCVKG
jgi:DtxR family Mn-dependent transcriptional regulator